jgi:hypothetical protein
MPIKNIEDLRDFMSQELYRLRNKQSSAAVANASAHLADKIMTTIKMELTYNKMMGAIPNIDFLKGSKHLSLKKKGKLENV